MLNRGVLENFIAREIPVLLGPKEEGATDLTKEFKKYVFSSYQERKENDVLFD